MSAALGWPELQRVVELPQGDSAGAISDVDGDEVGSILQLVLPSKDGALE